MLSDAGAALLRMLRAFLNRDVNPPLRLQRRRLASAQAAVLPEQAAAHPAAISSASRALQGAATGSVGSGSDPFIAGLQRYLAAHKFGSATTADLWAALTDASGVLSLQML